MRTIIAGSRDILDYNTVEAAINESGFEITEVVSGRAQGVDTLGEEWADNHGIDIQPFPADWDNLETPGAVIKVNSYGKKYNVKAGFDRNQVMADYAEALIAVTNGSGGTDDMIKKARAGGLKLFIYDIRETDEGIAF